MKNCMFGSKKVFQSTPSVGRATRQYVIIALREKIFQSTPSVGRATLSKDWKCVPSQKISIHALRGEGDVIISS